MSRLRQRTKSPGISIPLQEKNQGCNSVQHPWLSFQYMTANKNYSLKYLERISGSEREKTLANLCTRFEELTSRSWLFWEQQPKRAGLETISYDQLNFQSGGNIVLTKDTGLYVFRFDTYRGNGKGRIIGFKTSPCAVYHVIGYDFDFSAYRH